MTLTSHHCNRAGALEDHLLEYLHPLVQLPPPLGASFRPNKQSDLISALSQPEQVALILICDFSNAFHDVHRFRGK